jgi:protoporphyrinogen oxidase
MASLCDAETIILGGGISGLATAKYLEVQSAVLEAAQTPGGLCRSFSRDGFTYDIGGHILFSKNEEIVREMASWLGDNVAVRRRKNCVWYKDRFVKYPFENGLSVLDKQDIFEILTTFLNRPKEPPRNLEQWCYARFGAGLAEKYLVPYNRKIWKREPSTMSLHWVERIPSPPTEDIIKSAIGIETEGYTLQLNFRYPKQGGYGSLVKGLAASLPEIHTGFRARSIRRTEGVWEVTDGAQTFRSRRLVSTIPVFDLMACLTDVPGDVRDAVAALQYNSMLIVMVAVNSEALTGRTAIYIPHPDVLAHRVCYMRAFSDATAPPGCSHLVAEITLPAGDPLLRADAAALTERVIDELHSICGFAPGDVITTDIQRIEYAYPVYDLDYTRKTQTIYDFLDSREIRFTGRFASFLYVNSDKCVEMAKALATDLNEGGTPRRDWSHL